MTRLDLTFREARRVDGTALEVVFDLDDSPRRVGVLVNSAGQIHFPHSLTESGEPLESREHDEVARQRARHVVAQMQATAVWIQFTGGATGR